MDENPAEVAASSEGKKKKKNKDKKAGKA
jgi:hypothetical protein